MVCWHCLIRATEIGINYLQRRRPALTITFKIGLGLLSWPGTRSLFEIQIFFMFFVLSAYSSRFLSSYFVLGKTLRTLKLPVQRYFTFQETDERNLSVAMESIPSIITWLVVTILPIMMRLLWLNLLRVSGFAVVIALLIFVSSLAQYHVIGRLITFATYVLVRIGRAYFFIVDRAFTVCHGSMRKIESWESRRAASSINTLRSYAYQPLVESKREIRILRLLRRTNRPEICCEFIITSVDEAPPFEAVSYTWGEEAMTECIVVEGRRLLVSPTVSKWLRYRRSFFSGAYLWIDAVCINQKDNNEKMNQLLIMRDIYSQATRTIVWLAHPAEVHDSYKARSLIMTLCAFMILNAAPEHIHSVTSRDASMPSVTRLLARSYFDRIWVVQEIALAKCVHVAYGDVVMNWDSIALFVSAVATSERIGNIMPSKEDEDGLSAGGYHLPLRHLVNVSEIAQARRTCQEGNRLSLIEALVRLRSFTATIPHDNIYGFLGMVDESPKLLPIATYDQPVEELFAAITKLLFGRNEALPILQLAGSSHMRSLENLPSWVPDMSQSYHGPHFRFQRLFDIQAHETPHRELNRQDTNWNILQIHHRTLDTIRVIQTQVLFSGESFSEWSPQHDRSRTTLNGLPEITPAQAGLEFILKFQDWHDEALSLARSTPLVQHQYTGDITETVFRTLVCNDPQLLDQNGGRGLGLERCRLIMRLVEMLCRPPYTNTNPNVEFDYEAAAEELGLTIEECELVAGPQRNHFFFCLGAAALRKKFCVMSSGKIGLVPMGSTAGDIVSYIRDQNSAFVLRPTATDEYMELVGSCYVHGFPDEPSNDDGDSWETASLI